MKHVALSWDSHFWDFTSDQTWSAESFPLPGSEHLNSNHMKRIWEKGQEKVMKHPSKRSRRGYEKKHTKMYRESLGINYENPPTFLVTSWQHHLQGGAQLLVYNSSFHEFDIYHGYHRLLTQLYQLLYATITCTFPFLLLYSTILSLSQWWNIYKYIYIYIYIL